MTVRITRPARVSGLPDTIRLRSRAIRLLREIGRARPAHAFRPTVCGSPKALPTNRPPSACR